MVTVKKRKPATIQNTNESVRDAPKLSKSRSAVLNPMCRFLARCCSLDTFVIAKASTQKENWAVVVQACFFASSFSVLRFTYEVWTSTGRGVVSVSRIREIETAKISSEESGRFFGKICTSENFPLYGTWC